MLETMFKDNLKFLLAKTGKTKSDIARALSVSPQSAGDYLNGTIPKTDKMIALADYFGVDPGHLHYWTIDEGMYIPPQTGLRLPVLKLSDIDSYLKGDFEPEDSWYCTFEVSKDAFIVVQEGDSMVSDDESLSIPEGSMVIIEPGAKPVSKKTVLAKRKGSGDYTIKRYMVDLNNAFLVSNNSLFPPISDLSDIEIVGVAKYSVSTHGLY